MRVGDVVMATSIQVRTDVVKPSMRASFKSNPKTAMVFIACGSVGPDGDKTLQARQVLEYLGWTASPEREGEDLGISRACGARP